MTGLRDESARQELKDHLNAYLRSIENSRFVPVVDSPHIDREPRKTMLYTGAAMVISFLVFSIGTVLFSRMRPRS